MLLLDLKYDIISFICMSNPLNIACGLLGILEGAEGLLKIGVGWADTRQHHCAAVAPERVLHEG